MMRLINLEMFNYFPFFFKSTNFIPLLTPSPPRKGLNSSFVQSKIINPLKTKIRELYLKTQFVPRSKHFSSRL